MYDKAALFARKNKLNVDDWVNNVLQKIVMKPSKAEEAVKEPAGREMFSWNELEGIFASDKSDSELRDEYLEDKYGI